MSSGGPFTVGELARRLGGQPEGDNERRLVDVRGLAEAGPEHLSFLSNPRYTPQLSESRAGAVLLKPSTDARGHTAIRVDDPYAAFARALALFHPPARPRPGVDPRAAVAADATVHPEATVEAFAWVGPRAQVGRGSWIESGAYVGAGARVGEECRLMAQAVLCADCVLGDRVWLNPGAVVGGEGFGFAPTAAGHVKIPQVGVARIEDDVEIGANSCVDRATMGETVVGRGSKLDNLVQVGHAARLGEHVLMAAYAAVAGSATVEDRCVIAAKGGVINHLRLGKGSQVAVQSVVLRSQPPQSDLAGTPAIDRRGWRRAVTAFAELPALLRRMRTLEKRLAALEGKEER